MHYEINVSNAGSHIFATAPRSLTNYQQAKQLYKLFLDKFPESLDYKVTVTKIEAVSHNITFDIFNDIN